MAFLRAINTPGRNVKMDRLRRAFESMGYDNVDTFIASGNVIFDADKPISPEGIESALERQLGFSTAVYLRTAAETIAVADAHPFGASVDTGYEVSFLPAVPDPRAVDELLGTITGTDRLAVSDRELYWLLGGPRSESAHKEATTVKILGMQMTRRAIRTVQRIADTYLR